MSYAYPPSLGGIELFSSVMREAFEQRGHAVRVVTNAPSNEREEGVLRRPEKPALREAIAWADLCFVSGVSMNYQIPALRAGKPIVITHHAWQEEDDAHVTALQRLKLLICRYGLNITVNRALAADLPMPAMAIHNPVHTEIDLGSEFAARPCDLIFVGRLVSQKGVPVLLDAMAKLKQRGIAVSTTIVGDGSDRQALEAQARDAGIDEQVRFTGRVDLARVNALLGEHRMMIVPSVYREPFPMAVLEGLAAGCLLIASHTGGLPEGVGPCGMTFPMRDSGALADRIEEALANPAMAAAFRKAIPAHLDTMKHDRIVDQYLEAFERFLHHRVGERMTIRRAARLTIAEMTGGAERAR
jgi:glycosyltransferase involved in cell wall biosynthesis